MNAGKVYDQLLGKLGVKKQSKDLESGKSITEFRPLLPVKEVIRGEDGNVLNVGIGIVVDPKFPQDRSILIFSAQGNES